MEKEKLKHIALELVFTWLFLALVFAFAIQQKSIDICIFATVFAVGHFIQRTFRWILFTYDKIFDKTVTLKTKGYSRCMREPIYYYFTEKYKRFYSIVQFDDPSLKGRFVYLEDDFSLKHGELLEVTYYKNSKVIKSVKRM